MSLLGATFAPGMDPVMGTRLRMAMGSSSRRSESIPEHGMSGAEGTVVPFDPDSPWHQRLAIGGWTMREADNEYRTTYLTHPDHYGGTEVFAEEARRLMEHKEVSRIVHRRMLPDRLLRGAIALSLGAVAVELRRRR